MNDQNAEREHTDDEHCWCKPTVEIGEFAFGTGWAIGADGKGDFVTRGIKGQTRTIKHQTSDGGVYTGRTKLVLDDESKLGLHWDESAGRYRDGCGRFTTEASILGRYGRAG